MNEPGRSARPRGARGQPKRFPRILLTGLLLLVAVWPAPAGGGRESGDTSRDETAGTGIDYLGVAALMIRDGNFDRATKALSEVDTAAEGTDLMRYYTLSGLVALHFADYQSSIDDFEAAVALGQHDPLVYAYLGEAYFASGSYRRAIEAIDAMTDFDALPDIIGVKSQAQWRLGELSEAIASLDEGIARYPDHRRFAMQRILFLIELDLTREAADESREYLAPSEDDPLAYVTIGDALRRGGHSDGAIETLEMANLRFPGNDRVLVSLARAYLDSGDTLTAARILEQASLGDDTYTYDAAELYRRAGHFTRALYLNTLVLDPEKRTAQEFNMLIEMKRFEEALGLEPRLEQLGLLEDEAYRYAIAYVCLQVGEYRRAIEYIDRLREGDYARQAEMLESAVEAAMDREVPYF